MATHAESSSTPHRCGYVLAAVKGLGAHICLQRLLIFWGLPCDVMCLSGRPLKPDDASVRYPAGALHCTARWPSSRACTRWTCCCPALQAAWTILRYREGRGGESSGAGFRGVVWGSFGVSCGGLWP